MTFYLLDRALSSNLNRKLEERIVGSNHLELERVPNYDESESLYSSPSLASTLFNTPEDALPGYSEGFKVERIRFPHNQPLYQIDFPKVEYGLGDSIVGKVIIRPYGTFEQETIKLMLVLEEKVRTNSSTIGRKAYLSGHSIQLKSGKFQPGYAYSASFTLRIPEQFTLCDHTHLESHMQLPPSNFSAQYQIELNGANVQVKVVPRYKNKFRELGTLHRGPFKSSTEIRKLLSKEGQLLLQTDYKYAVSRGVAFEVPLSLIYSSRKNTPLQIAKVEAELISHKMFSSTKKDHYFTRNSKESDLRVVSSSKAVTSKLSPVTWRGRNSTFSGSAVVKVGPLDISVVPTYQTCLTGVEHEIQLTIYSVGNNTPAVLKVPIVVD